MGNRFFSSDGGGKVWVWDLAQGRLEAQVPMVDAGFGVKEQIEPVGDRFYLYSALEEGAAAAFDMKTLTQVPLSQGEINTLLADIDYDPSLPNTDDERATQPAFRRWRAGGTAGWSGGSHAGGGRHPPRL